ncbi:hypothetical protein B0H13DRAFT_1898867 [Mycena leptocephala]|nr:hypothetical protein B0H13DRAFT_1898867 [Mycena leptocephala]
MRSAEVDGKPQADSRRNKSVEQFRIKRWTAQNGEGRCRPPWDLRTRASQVQESRIYAECGTSQRGGRQDKREDERKLETRVLWKAVPAWIEMWNERPKPKVGIRTSQWREGMEAVSKGEARRIRILILGTPGSNLKQQGEQEFGTMWI